MKDFARSAKDTDHVVLHGGVAFSCHMNVALLASCINEGARLWLQEEAKPLVEALEKIGNTIGGPTMAYSREVERKELLRRMETVSRMVVEALAAWKAKARRFRSVPRPK